MSRDERMSQSCDQIKPFTNLYFNNFDTNVDEQCAEGKMRHLFERYGKVLNCKVSASSISFILTYF
jgi:hypothetical protein